MIYSFLKSIFCFLALALSFSIVAHAQEKITENTLKWSPDNAQLNVPIEHFNMIEGSWVGDGLGGQCEEYWSSMKDSLMIGMFRFMKNEKTVFTEFMYLVHDSVGWQLRVKHFNSDFTTWEEKDKSVNFRLIRAEKSRIFFNGITFERPDENSLVVFLAMKHEDRKKNEEKFVFRRLR